MKKLVLFLLLALPVYASIYVDSPVASISPGQFSQVMCERVQKIGVVGADDLGCCIDANGNAFCENDEISLGTCFGNWCMLESLSFEPWFSWRWKQNKCQGMAVLAGQEFDALLTWAGCEKTAEVYWCCSPYVFPQVPTSSPVTSAVVAEKPKSKGALLILDAGKWRGLELGQFKRYLPEQRALQFEKSRCAFGGGNIRIIDAAYGSFFYDTNNLKPGMRAFYLTESEVTPLVTWCK